MITSDLSLPMTRASIASLPFGMIAVAEFVVFVAVHGFAPVMDSVSILFPWYFLPIFVLGLAAHEMVHGLTWMIAGAVPFSTLRFGIQRTTFTPYVHCTVPLRKSVYVAGTMMPAILLGIFPFIAAMVSGDGWILMFGILFTFTASGDFLIVRLLHGVEWNALVEDHPARMG